MATKTKTTKQNTVSIVTKVLNSIDTFIGKNKVEVCGQWVWVTLSKSDVDTREKLKAVEVDGKKFKFSGNKKKWYFAGKPSFSRKIHSMQEIRERHGSVKV